MEFRDELLGWASNSEKVNWLLLIWMKRSFYAVKKPTFF